MLCNPNPNSDWQEHISTGQDLFVEAGMAIMVVALKGGCLASTRPCNPHGRPPYWTHAEVYPNNLRVRLRLGLGLPTRTQI